MHEKENKNNVDMNMLRRFSSVKLIGNFFGTILLLSKKKFEKRSHNKVKYTNYDRYTVYILVSIYVELQKKKYLIIQMNSWKLFK